MVRLDHSAGRWHRTTGHGQRQRRPSDREFLSTAARFPQSFGASEVISHTGGSIALWEPGPMVADRVMLVGDAARQVKPDVRRGDLSCTLRGGSCSRGGRDGTEA